MATPLAIKSFRGGQQPKGSSDFVGWPHSDSRSSALPCTSAYLGTSPSAPLSSKEPYLTLGLASAASAPGMKKAYRRLALQGQRRLSRAASWTSPTNEIAVDGSANAVAVAASTLDVTSADGVPKDPPATAKEATISAIMADVANLVKLVDSRDIVELELKHLDYELVIRKKEALTPPPAPPSYAPPQMIAQAPYPAYAPPTPPPVAASAPAAPPAQTSPPSAAPAVSPGSDLPRILSPMAGTFYKCPAPGEPPFVKVGDKVQKGQVICIVEAMKLMNEIEADQSGTVVEILAEDGKPVSVDTPLYAIKP